MIKSFRRSKRSSSSSSSSPKHTIQRLSDSPHTSPKTRAGRHSGPLQNGADLVLTSPKRVIKALYDYRTQGPGELAFLKGDFFHVIGGDLNDDPDGWYEATNPMTGDRGMVPVSYFEVFNRSRPAIIDQSHEQPPAAAQPANGSSPLRASGRNSAQNLYAVTLYDFVAERPDELDIAAGENLIICAHHDYEWFIAKPINRLGGPGLVPVSYVKIIDLVPKASSSHPQPAPSDFDDDVVKLIQKFNIPTVEQWKDQTARYQALTIPLGSILQNTPPPSNNANSLYFAYGPNGGDGSGSNRSSLSLSNTTIVEASVDLYQLDHGRYQYLIVAKLSLGKTRYLLRYYQDFYDLQVKLLEMFPHEAGKIENSKRIIPLIPGPLINVNDSISKLRREKLDYYLRNLVALPPNILRSEEVLSLFEVLDNGFDKEVVDGTQRRERRALKPISQKSFYHQDRLLQYLSQLPALLLQPNTLSPTHQRSLSLSSTNLLLNADSTTFELSTTVGSSVGTAPAAAVASTPSAPGKVKVKFYYEDDIFVLLLPTNLRLQDLKLKLSKRLLASPNTSEQPDVDAARPADIHLYLKNDYDEFVEAHNLADEDTATLNETQSLQLQALEIDEDDKFHESLYDKCKIVIIAPA
jgi:bud emergence protein 1